MSVASAQPQPRRSVAGRPAVSRFGPRRFAGWLLLYALIVVYASIAFIVFISLNVTLSLLHLLRWAPFAMSVYLVVLMLICSMLFFAPQRQAEADRLGPSPAS